MNIEKPITLHRFFSKEIYEAMLEINFRHPLIHTFLKNILCDFAHDSSELSQFYFEHMPHIGMEAVTAGLGKKEVISKNLLFGLSFFPESFKRERRLLEAKFYLSLCRKTVNFLSFHSEKEVWTEVDRNFTPTYKTLELIRKSFSFKKINKHIINIKKE